MQNPNLDHPKNSLTFDSRQLQLRDPEGRCVSLDELLTTAKLPWEGGISRAELDDLPCRLEGTALSRFFSRLWECCEEGASVFVRVPHPRHDSFLVDPGYVRPVLPETFAGLSERLGRSYDCVETAYLLDSQWEASVKSGEVSYDDIATISRQVCNVIQEFRVELRVRKSSWRQPESIVLTSEMRGQLLEQLTRHEASGNLEAAATIRRFLEERKE